MSQGNKFFTEPMLPPATTVRRISTGTVTKPAALHMNDQNSAIVSKLVRDIYSREYSGNQGGANDVLPQSPEYINNVVNHTSGSIADAKNIQQNLPDIELGKQILVSSIISPNDLMSGEITYSSTDEHLGELSNKLLDIVSDYFDNTYKIQSELPKILGDALFDTGSYPIAVLPESSIDYMINSNTRVTTESLMGNFDEKGQLKNFGVLGNPSNSKPFISTLNDLTRNATLESSGVYHIGQDYSPNMDDMLCMSAVDNFDILKLPQLKKKSNFDKLQDIYGRHGVSMEARRDRMLRKGAKGQKDDKTTKNMLASLYPDRQFMQKTTIRVPTLSESGRETVGHPLVIKLPSECVIPVHTPSDPSDHIGYFVVLDRTGNPVRMPTDIDFFSTLNQQFGQNQDMGKYLINKTKNLNVGLNLDNVAMQTEDAIRVFTDIVEQDLVKRLENGLHGDGVAVAKPQEIYRLMFARACARMYTQLLYIPASLLTYIAFDHNDNGIGVSLLEKTKMLGALRSSLLYSNVMAGLKNGITRRIFDISLDRTDPNPSKTVEILKHLGAASMRGETPFGSVYPSDIITGLQNAGIVTRVKGDHPGFPETDFNVEYSSNQYMKVDTDLDDMLKKWHMMGIWLTPETVELSMGADFATSVVSSNILLAKRAKMTQISLCEQLVKFIKSYVYNSKILMDRLREVTKTEWANVDKDITDVYDIDGIVTYFITTIELQLPEPDMSEFDMQSAALDNYISVLEKVLPSFINDQMFNGDNLGKLSAGIPATIEIIKAVFIRRYLRVNNFMPEVFDIVDTDGDDNPIMKLLDEHEQHMTGLSKSLFAYMQKIIPRVEENDKMLDTLTDGKGLEGESGGFGGGGGGFGGDDFGGGFDSGSDSMGNDFGVDTGMGGGNDADLTAGGAEPEDDSAEQFTI